MGLAKRSAHYKYIGLTVAILALLALGIYLYLSLPLQSESGVDSIEQRIQPLDRIVLDLSSDDGAQSANLSAEEIVKTKCSACHTAGTAGAPKLGNAEEWRARIQTGLDTLTKSVLNGKNAMPSKGGFNDLTDEQVRQAVILMANDAGAKFK